MIRKKAAGLLLAGLAAFALQGRASVKREEELRRTYEKKLRAMRKKNREETERLYASIAHTIRMPLSIAMGYAGLIQKGIVTQPEEKEQYINKICNQIVYLNDSMKSILDAKERPFENSQKRKEEQTELGALISSVAPDFKYTAALYGDKFLYKPPARLVWVNAGETMLKKVFYNLMENSLKYMERRGTIRVRVEVITGGRVMVVWRDDGKGMAASDIPRLFEKGWRGVTYGAGSGMGLYFVKKTIDSLGGAIRAVSSPGHGMTFYILLPEVK